LFVLLKKNTILVLVSILLVLILCSFLVATVISSADNNRLGITVVIDAGHGGRDGGCVGINTNIKESDLNLVYASVLGNYFRRTGIKVVYTRTSKNGLYSVFGRNYKQEDMRSRKEIIETAKADIVISIHMNTFPVSSERGIQVFYDKSALSGRPLAEYMQNQLKANLNYARSSEKAGDFYILNCTDVPSVLVECGFLSCPEEEALLVSADYQQKLCYYLYCGAMRYLGVLSSTAV